MELKKYAFGKDLISFIIGCFIGSVLTFCNPVVRDGFIVEKEPISIQKLEVNVNMPNELENEIPYDPEIYEITEEEIAEEIRLGEMELIAQLVQAEAGNQDLLGKRLVVDVVLNRVDDPRFPNTVEEVIFQKDPVQFTVTTNGAFDKAGWHIDEKTYQAVSMEYENRTNDGILYFSTTPCNGINHFKVGDHWFGY